MIYFSDKEDLNFIVDFRKNIEDLWKFESKASENLQSDYILPPEQYKNIVISEASEIDGYSEVRTKVSKALTRASIIADINAVPIHLKSIPPPAVGGAIIPINLFEAILIDNSYGGINRQMILDALDRTIGACENRVKLNFHKLINPFYWIKSLIIFILRIPFLLLSTTGFNISKIEDNLFAKLFKILEIIILVYFFLKHGLKVDDIKDIISKI